MASNTATNALMTAGERTRVGGSAFTVLRWNNSYTIGFVNELSIVSPTPVGTGATPIHPIDTAYVADIITPGAQNIGTITCEMFERYNKKFWEDIPGLEGAPDLVNVFLRVAAFGHGALSVVKVIRPPLLSGASPVNPLSPADLTAIAAGNGAYGEIYNNAVVTNIEDGETINIGTMQVTKRLTLAYSHVTIVPANGADYTNLATQLSQRTVPTLS